MSDSLTIPFGRKAGHTEVAFSSELQVPVNGKNLPGKLKLTYAPDRTLISRAAYPDFLADTLKQQAWQTPEDFLEHLVATLYDSLVPLSLWAELEIKTEDFKQKITAEKHQPKRDAN